MLEQRSMPGPAQGVDRARWGERVSTFTALPQQEKWPVRLMNIAYKSRIEDGLIFVLARRMIRRFQAGGAGPGCRGTRRGVESAVNITRTAPTAH